MLNINKTALTWFEQVEGWNLGNFIMATPLLVHYFNKFNTKVPVFFNTKSLEDLYKESPYIKVLSKRPSHKPFETTKCPRREKGESDTEALCRIHFGLHKKDIPHTYVPVKVETVIEKKSPTLAIFNGCLTKKTEIKDIGDEVRKKMIETTLTAGVVPVILGSKSDFKKFWSKIDLSRTVNYLDKLTLKDTVGVLSQCDYFMSNDTGLYHAAGALNIKGLVIWTKTDEVKNKSPSKKISHFKSKSADVGACIMAVDHFFREIK